MTLFVCCTLFTMNTNILEIEFFSRLRSICHSFRNIFYQIGLIFSIFFSIFRQKGILIFYIKERFIINFLEKVLSTFIGVNCGENTQKICYWPILEHNTITTMRSWWVNRCQGNLLYKESVELLFLMNNRLSITYRIYQVAHQI